MHISRKIFSILALSYTASGFTATEFEGGVPVELVRFFAGAGAVYSDLSNSFPEFDLPDGLQVMGSMDRGLLQRVILRSELSGDDAVTALVNSFLNEGWVPLISYAVNQPQNGFVSSAPPADVPVEICHDDYGFLTLRGYEGVGNRAYLRLNGSVASQPDFSCARQNQQRQDFGFGGRRPGFSLVNQQYMPRLELPEEASQPIRRSPFGLFSGSNNDIEISTNLSIDWGIEQVYLHFAEQMSAQGWELDTESTGDVTASGSWTRSPEADLVLVGLLTIVKVSESGYQMKFRLLSTGTVSPAADRRFFQ